MRYENVEYSTDSGLYLTTHDVKVPFFCARVFLRKIIMQNFHVNKNEGELVIGYDMIIGCDLMVPLGNMYNSKHQALQWDCTDVPIREPISLLGQPNLTSRNMRKVLIHTAEPVSKMEYTERMVKTIDSTYGNVDLEQEATNTTQLNDDYINQLPGLLK